ncbi:hypothetical protein AbraIFM66951_006807 [Aspergillus brasiliensis]|uniref:Uncharacterized protein n=1 Tax=Aspergillus brasiliensis TaxID=319629 RepID=A0A9W6DIX6_9EURO|nr:hypothetical protein AbraCBS73388_007172 [Aspergillus brasiliensis]GKZ44575.1 hypothetical protein AbraIFM66951_006807 [Aspergillus brasiliensis]
MAVECGINWGRVNATGLKRRRVASGGRLGGEEEQLESIGGSGLWKVVNAEVADDNSQTLVFRSDQYTK